MSQKESNDIDELIKRTEEIIKYLESLTPTDRLDTVDAIGRCLFNTQSGTQGWVWWFQRYFIMKKFDDKELKEMFELWRQMAITLLKASIKFSRILESRKEKDEEVVPQSKGLPYVL